jgi:O-succinylbenzoate synthase
MNKTGIEIFYSPYELQFVGGYDAPKRQGALVKIGEGYADLHPWTELGDLSLEEELDALSSGHPTPLGHKTFYFAQLDHSARQQKRNLMNGLRYPNNHLHVGRWNRHIELDDLRRRIEESGFRRIKVKFSDFFDPKEFSEFRRLIDFTKSFEDLKLRVDFNYSFGDRALDFEDLLNTFGDEDLDQIDFFEDPFLFEDLSWTRLQEKFNCRFALDRGDHEVKVETDQREDKGTPTFAVAVLKPAIEDVAPIVESAALNMRRIVFTSYLDHPLGQVCAAYEAGLHFDQNPLLLDDCGLLSHVAYEKTAFSEALNLSGTQLLGAAGYGWGFDELLRKQDWKKLL